MASKLKENPGDRIAYYLLENWGKVYHYPFLKKSFRKRIEEVFGIPSDFGNRRGDGEDEVLQKEVDGALYKVAHYRDLWHLFCAWVEYPHAQRTKIRKGDIFISSCGRFMMAAGMRNAIKNGHTNGFHDVNLGPESKKELENRALLSAKAAVKYAPLYDDGCCMCLSHVKGMVGYGFHQRF